MSEFNMERIRYYRTCNSQRTCFSSNERKNINDDKDSDGISLASAKCEDQVKTWLNLLVNT